MDEALSGKKSSHVGVVQVLQYKDLQNHEQISTVRTVFVL
jgi:hypothetical protein